MRRVLEAEIKNEILRLTVQRFGQAKPTKLDICRERDRRTPTAKRAARVAYQRVLHRVLQRRFAGFTVDRLSTRGLLHRGRSAFAVLGVNSQETQGSIDAALTFGILWLDACRVAKAGKFAVEGLKLFLPPSASTLTRERVAHLNQDAAKWQLYELEERDENLKELDISDCGNVATRLVHSTDELAVEARFAAAVSQVRSLMSESEIATLSAGEIAFRCHGLEFARARLAHQPESFNSIPEVVFGLGAQEKILGESNITDFARLVRSIGEVRHADGPRDHPLWRLHPERWLESLVIRDVAAIDERLETNCLYSQVPAFSAADRAMIDVLTVTRDGRLAVVELKADEDIHLPLQGLDYWARVAWHHARGEFQRFGYFPGQELRADKPQLLLVAPALHVHPSTDTLLHYIAAEIDWVLAGIDERWRDGVRVVFRKRPAQNAQLKAG